MSTFPRHPDQALTAAHPTGRPPVPPRQHPDRGLVHLVPALAATLGVLVYPALVCVRVFTAADADVATRPAAPFAAGAAALLAALAGLLIASFVTTLAYTVARFGATHRARVLQLVGLAATLVCAVAGLGLAFVVADM